MADVSRTVVRPGVVCALTLAVCAAAAQASQPPRGGDSYAPPHAVAADLRTGSVQGAAWKADSSPLAHPQLRLRDVNTGTVEAATVGSDAGQFTFSAVLPGTYAVELVNDNARVLAVSAVFTVEAGQRVATFVRLSTQVPWFSGFFSNAAMAAALTAASEGITALAPVARPVSPGK